MNYKKHISFKDQQIKILRCPSLMYNYSGILPFGLSTITAMLTQKGYHITQDDLDVKCASGGLFPRNRWGKQFPDKEMMLDIERVRRFWEDGEDSEISLLTKNVLSYTDIHDCDTVLISCIEGDDSAAVLALCLGKYMKSKLGKLVIIGGEAFPHMQPIKSDIEYFYKTGCLDYYIQGYGETALLELFDRLDNGMPIDDVSGLIYCKEDGTRIENRPLFTRPEVIPDFDGLPMHLYYKMADELGSHPADSKKEGNLLVLPVKLNFCCPMKCSFCISSGDEFTKVTNMEPDKVARAIKSLVERYNTRYFMFADDLFNTSRKFAEDIADAFIELKLDIMWSDCAYARDLDLPLLRKLRRAGAVRFVWGVESASLKLRKLVNKDISIADVEQILKWSHEAGIYNAIEIIAGLPHEEDEDIETTVEFLKRNRQYVDQVFLNPFSLITGSLMHKNPEQYGLTNIRPVATIFNKKPDEVYSWIQRYTFDEVNGLPWKEKVKQIERSFLRIHQVQLELEQGGHDIHELFQLFTKFGEKRLITDFQTSRDHQGFDYFGREGKKGHSPGKSTV